MFDDSGVNIAMLSELLTPAGYLMESIAALLDKYEDGGLG